VSRSLPSINYFRLIFAWDFRIAGYSGIIDIAAIYSAFLTMHTSLRNQAVTCLVLLKSPIVFSVHRVCIFAGRAQFSDSAVHGL